ncbi:hypothetical protein PHYBOEH_011648 [Phytophthora boehmeriae]|uniref:Protein kinase domain-containing protein n=1 Tax=Phytophthora boehmeriae TaxID=109152 RepID=A0A8T1X8K7_9STRA|nr:hypothetical protein PHYBOEH_011648 [Phytophthora boehmeriae]
MSPQLAKSRKNETTSSSSNNKEYGEEIVYPPFEEMSKLSVVEPSTPRAGDNNYAKELAASNLVATPHRTNGKDKEGGLEEPEDKSESPSTAESKKTRPRTSRSGSDDSSNSSTAPSSRTPSNTIPAQDLPSPSAFPPPKVTFRKGEKSFLDFHQHYAITRHLGEGSYSTVKQVTHRKKGGFYACKIVDKLSLSDVDRSALSHEDWAGIHPDIKTLISKMLHVDPKERPPMAELRCHPWIRVGRATLERLRREGEERRRLADLTRRQQAASVIRKKLVMGNVEVVKYGRNGLPHRTKLRLSTDGKCLSWQPKLLKRSLLRYQNSRGFTSLFGIGGKEHSSNSQPDLHSPQIDDNRIPNGGIVGNDHDDCEQSTGTPSASPPRTADISKGCASPSSSTSDAINEKRLWWRSLRRERGSKTERTASGGFTLNFSSRTESNPSSPVSPMASPETQVLTPSATSPLDDSIKLNDIRDMLTGDNAPFFAGHATNLPNTAKRAVDPACVLTVCTRFRELHLEFPNEGVRDGFMYLLQQATLPLEQLTQHHPPRLMPTTSLPPPPPQSLLDISRGPAVTSTTAVHAEPRKLCERKQRERSNRPEVDDENVKAVVKEAAVSETSTSTVASFSNQDE